MRARAFLASALGLLLLALAACTGLPTSGPVTEGLPPGEVPASPDFALLADRPQPGATPLQIVQGFIAAGTDPSGEWEIARLFLAPNVAWDPDAAVRIDDQALREYDERSSDTITLTVSSSSSLDGAGAYVASDPGTTALDFRLAQQSDGEWRISEAPDGIVLGRDVFTSVFRSYSVQYFDPTWEYLVPDQRWFPVRSRPVQKITTALTSGSPSAWLAASVASAFPADLSLNPVVTIDSGVADVDFNDALLGIDPDTIGRMRTQLEASLATAGVTSVQLSVAGEAIDIPPATTRDTRVASRPAVSTEDGFGFLSGTDIDPIPGLSAAIDDVDAVAAQLAPDLDLAGVLTAEGGVTRVAVGADPASVDTRPGLIPPTVDGFGFVWSVPEEQPSAIRATSADGSVDVSGAWPAATRIRSMQLSRDGARVVAVLVEGGRTLVYAAGVIREDGVPISLGAPERLAELPGEAVGAAWLDAVTVGVVTQRSTEVSFVEQPVGGEGRTVEAPAGIVQLAGGNQPATTRLRAEDGTFYERSGSGWLRTGTDILMLATQQGAP